MPKWVEPTSQNERKIDKVSQVQLILYVKPGPNEDESCREIRLSLSFGLELSCALSYSHRLSPALIEFEHAQIFRESRREFSVVWPKG